MTFKIDKHVEVVFGGERIFENLVFVFKSTLWKIVGDSNIDPA
jgi:hypothetical protein